MKNQLARWKVRRFTRRLWLGLSLFIFLLVVQPSKIFADINHLDETIKRIETEIETNMKTHHIPGMAFALADKKGVLYSRGFGLLDIRDDYAKVNEQTNFMLGSLSKVFVSLAVMQLYEKDILDIDQPVVHYLPWFSAKEATLSNQIKVRHLLNHSSGLPDRLNVHDITSIDKQDRINKMIRKISEVSLTGQPGEIFEYTNMNTDLLQILIEEVTGEPFAQYMEQHIFASLDMERTGYFAFDGSHLSNSATGHRYHWGQLEPFKEELSYATSGSAGLSSNVSDLAKFIVFLLNDGEGHRSSPISSDSIHQMFMPNQHGAGFNWHVFPHNIYMEGGLPGFTTTLILSADKSFGMVLLANSKQDITFHSGFNLFRIVAGGTPKPLLASDFPHVSSSARLIVMITALIGLGLICVAGMIGWDLWKGRRRLVFNKPNGRKLAFLLLMLSLFIAVMYYIYILLPVNIGVPSLHDYKKEPDIVQGILIFTITFAAFTFMLCLKLLFFLRGNER
ncbi:serine hydrolase domain-containing protein [Paenibacillus dendritiformis]|uniref:serine hydrolase domain-containing protein n=1 Tax=Paenibacillus dendritiformis TaxID=130049 RepID=UPI0036553AAF